MATSMPNQSPHAAQPFSTGYAAEQSQEFASFVELHDQSQPMPPAPGRARVFLTTLATIAMLAALFLLQGCNRAEEGAEAASPAAVIVEPSDAGAASEQVAPTPVPVVYAAGQVVTAAGDVAIYGEPSAAAAALELYRAGAAFTVLEPGLDLGAYPILAEGQSWVRVRSGDGLAGWLSAAALAP